MSQSVFPRVITESFIPNLWTFPSSQITTEFRNTKFLKFPIGQGKETLLELTSGRGANPITGKTRTRIA